MYDYREAMKQDILKYIRENVDLSEFASLEELKKKLNKDLWAVDSVTGNGSGSYTFNEDQAQKNICDNLDLLAEALEEFDCGYDVLKAGAEACDVTIRCYLLGECIESAMDEVEAELKEEHAEVQLAPDDLETGESIKTPRGTFCVTAMSREQMEAAGYGYHHESNDGKYLIMGNGTRAFAILANPPEPQMENAPAEMEMSM